MQWPRAMVPASPMEDCGFEFCRGQTKKLPKLSFGFPEGVNMRHRSQRNPPCKKWVHVGSVAYFQAPADKTAGSWRSLGRGVACHTLILPLGGVSSWT